MMIFICGLPNSGKTTYSSRFNNTVHVDEIVTRKPTQTIIGIIKESDDLCIEGVFPLSNYRKMYREAYQGNHTVCVWMNTPLDQCIKRENRGRAEILINNCHKVFEPPTYDEGWDEIWIIENNEKRLLKREGD